ncbi:DUF692 family multinuclear iron-containing protein [Geodermatophilus sp. SYSU D00691]
MEAAQGLLDVVEIEPQTAWSSDGAGYRQDEEFLRRVEQMPQPALVHGVGFPVGGTVPPDPGAVRLVADTVRRLAAPWVSEHLSFNRVADRGRTYGTLFLLPPVQTPASVAVAARNIASMKAGLPAPFAFETGVNYLRPQPGEMSDGAFFAAVAEEADCGILLDLHNLWCNERNGRQPVQDALAEMPLDRVWEVHLAGGQEVDGYWLDAHSGLLPEALEDLASVVLPELPGLHALVFEMMPAYLSAGRVSVTDAVAQLERLHHLWDSRGRARRPPVTGRPGRAADPARLPAPRTWESVLGRAVISPGGATGRDEPAADGDRASDGTSVLVDPGITLMREVLGRARAGMVAWALPHTVRHLLRTAGEDQLRELLSGFWRSAAPEQFAALEAEAFGRHLQREAGDVPELVDVMAVELAALRPRTSGDP